ncbi:MAG: creatininase family protein [Magnetovibrionaceae bacterium]
MGDSGTTRQSPWLSDLTWDEAKARLDSGAICLIPLGAACKEHGWHLPLGTDRLVISALAERLATAFDLVIAPVIDQGFYPAFTAFPPSQSLSARLFEDLLFETLSGFTAAGYGNLCVLNGGVSTEPGVTLACRRILDETGVIVWSSGIRQWGRSADHLLQDPTGGHADERETSVMLALCEAAVRMDRAEGRPEPSCPASVLTSPAVLSPETHPSGATGSPHLAEAEKGRAIFEAMVADLVRGLAQAFPEHRR